VQRIQIYKRDEYLLIFFYVTIIVVREGEISMSFNYMGHDYEVFTWDNVENPVGVVQLLHGAHEHISRYNEFANYLNANGFLVKAIEHLGHGTNATKAEHVSFDNENGPDVVLNAQVKFYEMLNEQYQLPMFVFGHSMGSFILRSILPKLSQSATAVVISGTTKATYIEKKGALTLAGILRRLKGPENYSKLLFDLTMGNLATEMLKNGEINKGYEWLTTDSSLYEEIEKDPFLHKKFTIGGNYDMITWIDRACDTKLAKRVKKDLPVYLMSGKLDPMNRGKVKLVEQFYLEAGLNNLTFVEYEGRHEMLNEVIREQVFADIVHFYKKQL